MNPTKHQIFRAMHRFGGFFASQLAFAWIHADSENQERIEAAFPDLIEQYSKFCDMLEKTKQNTTNEP